MRQPALSESAHHSTQATERIMSESRKARREAWTRVKRRIRTTAAVRPGEPMVFDPLWTWPRGVEFEALGLVEVINRFERATELAKDLREVFMGLDEGGAEPERLAKFHHGFG
jgi:hypothetical protein